MTGLIAQDAVEDPRLAERLNDLRSPAFWQKLNPQLHVDDAAYIQSVKPVTLDQADRDLTARRMAEEGYFQYFLPPAQQALPLAAMAQSVRTLIANGLVTPYAFMYDEFWLLFAQQAQVLGGFLGENFHALPDFWVWHVDPQKGESGWRPHRDKGRISLNQDGSPKSLTMWIPLTQATTLNGCMYVLPANRDPGYNSPNEHELNFDYPDIRALPAEPGHVLCWNQAVLHWGSRSSQFAQDARISVALEFQRADVPAFNLPLLSLRDLPSFETRLRLIAKQILQYAHIHTLTPAQEQFAREVLVETGSPVSKQAAAPSVKPALATGAGNAPSGGKDDKKRQGAAQPSVLDQLPAVALAQTTGKEPSPVDRQMLVNMFAQKQFIEAAAYAKAMTKHFPRNGFGWKVLGAALRQLGLTSDSLAPMQKAVQLMPADYEAFNNLGVTWRALGKLDQSVGCYQRAIELKPDYPDAHGNLGAALRDQGKYKEALAAFQRKLKLVPNDEEMLHQVASLSGVTTERAPDKYVAGVFDDYADRFDTHLQSVLKYDAPRQLVALVSKFATPPEQKWDVLDLGCGTGLMGVATAPLARQLVGVDLSAKMLEKAKARNLYQRLLQADLASMMKNEAPASFDVIFSADVFVYVGKLDEVTAEARRLLRPGGVFAFSIEALETEGDADYELQSSGRYRQSPGYIQRLAQANGFKLLEMAPTVIRMDDNKPINGYLVACQG